MNKITTYRERSSCLRGTDKEYEATIEFLHTRFDTGIVSITITGSGATRAKAIKNVKKNAKETIEDIRRYII